MQSAPGLDLDAGHLVPAAQVGERDAEAVRDGDECVALARHIKQHVCGRGHRGKRNGESFNALQAGRVRQLIGVCEPLFAHVELMGD